MSLPRALILAHHRGEASLQDLLRAFMVHRAWLVPAGFFGREARRDAYKVSFGPRHHSPPGELWLFTEHGTAQYAASQGAALGSFVLGVEGAEVFANLPADVDLVRVNPSGYTEDLFVLEGDALQEARAWARTVRVEEWVRRSPDPAQEPELLKALREHDHYCIPVLADGRMLAKPGEGGFAQPGVVCTSPDSYALFLTALEPSLRPQIGQRVVDGPGLRDELGRQEVDGVFLNPFGPGPTATWPLALVDLIAKS